MAPTHKQVLAALQEEIAAHDRPENQHNYQRFHKEKLDQPIGLKAPVLRKISNRLYRDVKAMPVDDLLDLCDYLQNCGQRYMRMFAVDWADRALDRCRPKDFKRFENWLKKHVDNWGACDHLCCGPIGGLIHHHPELASKTRPWRRSRNRWIRRAAAVCLIVPVRKESLLDEVLKTADILLEDKDDMVQKGYGWMLKEASNVYPDEIFAYVMKNKRRMPRTALRYAIEKLPTARRKEAMKKDW